MAMNNGTEDMEEAVGMLHMTCCRLLMEDTPWQEAQHPIALVLMMLG
jgi:hypothetical protein